MSDIRFSIPILHGWRPAAVAPGLSHHSDYRTQKNVTFPKYHKTYLISRNFVDNERWNCDWISEGRRCDFQKVHSGNIFFVQFCFKWSCTEQIAAEYHAMFTCNIVGLGKSNISGFWSITTQCQIFNGSLSAQNWCAIVWRNDLLFGHSPGERIATVLCSHNTMHKIVVVCDTARQIGDRVRWLHGILKWTGASIVHRILSDIRYGICLLPNEYYSPCDFFNLPSSHWCYGNIYRSEALFTSGQNSVGNIDICFVRPVQMLFAGTSNGNVPFQTQSISGLILP